MDSEEDAADSGETLPTVEVRSLLLLSALPWEQETRPPPLEVPVLLRRVIYDEPPSVLIAYRSTEEETSKK